MRHLRKTVTTAALASVAAAAGNLAELALTDARIVALPKIDTTKQERVAVVSVTIELEVRDK